MKSKITSKFQTTIPKFIRKKLKLKISDTIEWLVEDDQIVIKPLNKPFLKYKGKIKVGSGDVKKDILTAREIISEKYK